MRFNFGSDGSITIDQQRYVQELLAQHGMQDCTEVGTPMVPGTQLLPAGTALDGRPADPLLDAGNAATYRSITGGLLYASCLTRVDITASVNQLTRHMAKPTASHLAAAKHVLRYLKGTVSLGLTYRRSSDVDRVNRLVAYADASWASDITSARSQSGYVLMLNGSAVSWRSKRQSLICLSTAEAEYDSLHECVREVKYLRGLLGEMGLAQTSPTQVREDNIAAIIIASQPITSARTRHVALRFHFVREAIRDGTIIVQHCASQYMLADVLTKILPKPQHCNLRSLIHG
jgi:hypothetical protein